MKKKHLTPGNEESSLD